MRKARGCVGVSDTSRDPTDDVISFSSDVSTALFREVPTDVRPFDVASPLIDARKNWPP